ncbi:MAG: GNAT family N-acetyltransferase [Synechococcaceae cyanobacterium]|nr:GNAT family N-acetyltransferase [Synechococcaceae cyanobacterium]
MPSPAETPDERLGPLREADLEDCLALDRAALGGLWTPGQWRSELADPARPGSGLWSGAQLLGLACGWLVVDELHITALAVHPPQRRRGLGRRVLVHLLCQALTGGARHATLEVAVGNAAARALYADLGFQEAGVRRGYYRDGEDAVIQWLNLGRWSARSDNSGGRIGYPPS